MSNTKPPVKWVGGKTQILHSIIQLIPTSINNYYELFLGSGSVLLKVLYEHKIGNITISGNIYANDINPYLIGLYKNIQNNPIVLIEEITRITQIYNNCDINGTLNRKARTIIDGCSSKESYYYYIRYLFNNTPTEEYETISVSAMFLFINKTCFRGLYREGPNGFNVPYGNYVNPGIVDEKNIMEINNLIQDVKFTCGSYNVIVSNISENDFVYLDPPYIPETKTSFTNYNKIGFGKTDHDNLFIACNTMIGKKINILMSNSDTLIVREHFKNYNIKTVSCKRSINSKNPSSKTNELLITNRIQ